MTSLHFPCSHPPSEKVVPRPRLTSAPTLGSSTQTSRVLPDPTAVLRPLRDLLKLRKSVLPQGAAEEVVPVRGRPMGSSAVGARGWRLRRCRSRRATQQPEAQVSDSGDQPAHCALPCTGALSRGCQAASSRAGGAVRTGPRGPRPFSRSRICLSGNAAPPQDGARPGAQAVPGTAPSHQAPRPSLSAPSAGEPGEGE